MSVGLQRLRDDPDTIRNGAIAKREDPKLIDEALAADSERRQLLGHVDGLRAMRKDISAQVGAAMKAGGAGADELKARSTVLGDLIESLEEKLRGLDAQLDDLLLRIPNPPDPDVPVGGEEDSVIVRTWGEPATSDGKKPHWEVAERLGMFDLAAGAKVTGSGFPLYVGAGSRLQRALINFFLDLHTTEHGFTEVWPPALVNEASAKGTGQIPDKEDMMYVVTRDDL